MNALTKKAQLAAKTVSDPRWAAVIARSTEADGTFYYGVTSTGVYCRASCAARLARPENVVFTLSAKKPRKPASGPANAASRTGRRGPSNMRPR